MERKLLLTPECQDLWLLSPTMLFNYDKIFIDSRDYNNIANPRIDTQLKRVKAENIEKLKKFGLVEVVAFQDFLDEEKRGTIHEKAEQLIDRMLNEIKGDIKETDFFALSKFTHLEYQSYLENSIFACSLDDKHEFTEHVNRLKKVEERLGKLEKGFIDDALIEELAFTLKRISAKALAGLIVSKEMGEGYLYDTKEYLPFIKDLISEDYSKFIEYTYSVDSPTFEVIVGALSKREVPRIIDRRKVFDSLENPTDFENLKQALRAIEEYFGYLIESRPELAREKIVHEIELLHKKYDQEVSRVKGELGSKATWHVADMVVGQFAGCLSPWIEDAKKLNKKKIEENVAKEFVGKGNIYSSLFYISELWNRPSVTKIENHKEVADVSPENYLIWGEDKGELCWYES